MTEVDRGVQWLGRQSFLDDLASLDPELYQGLMFLKHYQGNPEDLSLNFAVTEEGAFASSYHLADVEAALVGRVRCRQND